MSDCIEGLHWLPTSEACTASAKAIGHAWAGWETRDGAIVIQINRHDAFRITLKYRETGPYLAVEVVRGGTGETSGHCERVAEVVQRYEEILKAHNALGDLLQSCRRFALPSTQRETP